MEFNSPRERVKRFILKMVEETEVIGQILAILKLKCRKSVNCNLDIPLALSPLSLSLCLSLSLFISLISLSPFPSLSTMLLDYDFLLLSTPKMLKKA
eukprot:sb/3479052/